jgi:RNA polymerase sigma-70 factor (ECF subfamily)
VQPLDTDDALVARCRDGLDQVAFAELVRRHRDSAFRLACSILGPAFTAEAEEVTQEVFLRVYHSLRSFRSEAKFSSWVYRIAFNQALNLKERVRFRVRHVGEQALDDVPSAATDPLNRVHEARRDEALAQCMLELPEVYQAALRLHYWMGASMAEVATLIAVPENTVKSYLHRARKLLHEMLKERGFDDV